MNSRFDKYRTRGAYHYAATLGASFVRRDLMLDALYTSVIAPLQPLNGKACLDAGSGEGVAAIMAARDGASVVCVDLEPEAVALGRRIATTIAVSDRVRQVQGDVMTLPFPDGVFDGAFSSEVIEHVADDRQFLRELARVVRAGGAVSITTPLRAADTPTAGYHLREYSRAELGALLSEFFDDVRVHSAWPGWMFRLYTVFPLRSPPSVVIRAAFKIVAALFGNPFRAPTAFDARCPVLVAVGRVKTAPHARGAGRSFHAHSFRRSPSAGSVARTAIARGVAGRASAARGWPGRGADRGR